MYTYFDSSKANDLDQVIQTLLLDNIQQELHIIKQKLNQVIENQERILEELRKICHKVEKIEEDNEEQLRKLASIEKNQQLQTTYYEMISADAEAIKYLSAPTFYEVMQK